MRVLFALRRPGKPYAWRPTDLFRALLVTLRCDHETSWSTNLPRLRGAHRRDRLCRRGVLIRLTALGLKGRGRRHGNARQELAQCTRVASLTQAERASGARFVWSTFCRALRLRENTNIVSRPQKKVRAKRERAA